MPTVNHKGSQTRSKSLLQHECTPQITNSHFLTRFDPACEQLKVKDFYLIDRTNVLKHKFYLRNGDRYLNFRQIGIITVNNVNNYRSKNLEIHKSLPLSDSGYICFFGTQEAWCKFLCFPGSPGDTFLFCIFKAVIKTPKEK